MKNLFTPITLGKLNLKNRFILAPMTRMRGELDGTPTDIMGEYFSQRSSFGLIVTEASFINPHANTYPGNGALFHDKHLQAWKRVIDRIHKNGGKISIQLYHVGRSGNKAILGADSVAPSPIAINGIDFLTQKPYETPKELTKSQIQKILEEFHNSAVLAKQAGFDGVQLHGANGYLVDQFIRDGTNQRKDEYGGSVENRSRFLLEAVDRLIDGFSAGNVSVRVSPTDRFNDMYDTNPLKLLSYLLPQLDEKGLQFVEVKRHSPVDPKKEKPGRQLPDEQIPNFYETLRPLLKKTPFVGNTGISIEDGTKLVQQGTLDAVAFGYLGICNPDLPVRVQNNYPLNLNADPNTFYIGGARGYTDYPEFRKENSQKAI
ncbi:hypothetical protein ABPG72_005407 [Tetrahymena utriculariae]